MTKAQLCSMNIDGEAVSVVVDGGDDVVQAVQDAGRRFVFSHDTDMALIAETQLFNAHICSQGQKKIKYQEVLENFLKSREYMSVAGEGMPIPTWKTLNDRMRKLINDRKKFDAKMRRSSGTEENYDEKARILNIIIEQVNRRDAELKTEKNEKSVMEHALKKAGEETRAMATRVADESSESETPRKKAKNVFSMDNTSAELSAAMKRQL